MDRLHAAPMSMWPRWWASSVTLRCLTGASMPMDRAATADVLVDPLLGVVQASDDLHPRGVPSWLADEVAPAASPLVEGRLYIVAAAVIGCLLGFGDGGVLRTWRRALASPT